MSFPQLDKELQEAVKTIHNIADVPLDVTQYQEWDNGELAENGNQDKAKRMYESLDEQFDLKPHGKTDEFYFEVTGEEVNNPVISDADVYLIGFHMSYEKDYSGRIKQDRFGNDIKYPTSYFVSRA